MKDFNFGEELKICLPLEIKIVEVIKINEHTNVAIIELNGLKARVRQNGTKFIVSIPEKGKCITFNSLEELCKELKG